MNIVVAACKNKGIGFKNKLPWKLKNELNYFKHLTIGKGNNAVIMGKNTWLEFNKALPKRKNFVLSKKLRKNKRNLNFVFLPNIKYIHSLHNYDDIWVIGGGQLYKNMINENKIQSIYYTDIQGEFDSDVFFPDISNNFTEIFKSRDYNEGEINYCMKIFLNNNIPITSRINYKAQENAYSALHKAGYTI
jgi:dihydrofolate reductase